MITSMMRYLARLPIAFPKTVVVFSLAITILFALALPRLHVSTDRNLLAGKDNEAFVRREKVNNLFGTSLVSVVVLKGRESSIEEIDHTRAEVRRAADHLAVALGEHDDVVRAVFFKADLGFFEKHALLFLPEKTVEQLPEILKQSAPAMELASNADGLPFLIEGMTGLLENAPAPESGDEAEVTESLEFFGRVFDDFTRWFSNPAVARLKVEDEVWASASFSSGKASDMGYLCDKDGKSPPIAVLFVQPKNNSQDMDAVSKLTDVLRSETSNVLREYPGMSGEVTGMPSIITDEMRAVTRDCIVAGIFSGLGVLLVFIIAFRSIRVSLFLVAPLGVGLLWSSGLTALLYGHLTLITSYFAAVLFGLGVAFTIHIVARFHEALLAGADRKSAVETALVSAGPGVVAGGGTTALAFFAIAFSEFQGFAEMGVISGGGVTMILITNLTLLPAALILWHPGPKAVRTKHLGKSIWTRLSGSRRLLPIFAVALTIGGAVAAFFVEFDYAVESLLPANAESVKGLKTLNKRTDFSMNYSIALASSMEEAEKLRQKFEKLPTVARAESLSVFIPKNQSNRLAAISRVSASTRELMAKTETALAQRTKSLAGTKDSLFDALENLADTLEDLAFDAKRAKRQEAKQLDKLVVKARETCRVLKEQGDDKRVQELEKLVFEGLLHGAVVLGAALDDKGFGADDLPVEIRRRYRSIDGQHYAVFVFPDGDIGEKAFFKKHVGEVLSVSEEATGHPVTHLEFTRMVHDGFRNAVILSALAVVLLVLLDLRTLKGLALALLPVVMGLAWTALLMALTGFKFNYANLMALPILIGTGVDYGVHLAHRAKQEGSVKEAARTTGRAIALTGLTTLIGFGSLLLGQHWGVRSLGLILVSGISFSLLAALVVVPGFVSWSSSRK